MKWLANENFPRAAVLALQAIGEEVVWIRDTTPGITDVEVLSRAMTEERILITFDKDFGELAYRSKLPATCGIVLFRISLQDLPAATQLIVATLTSRSDWPGHFAVVDDQRIRIRTLS